MDFLDVGTVGEEKKCFCCRNVKSGFDQSSAHCLPEHDEKPSTMQSLPQVFHFHPSETGTATDICVKNISKEIQSYSTLLV